MNAKPIAVLLIEDNPDDAALIRRYLTNKPDVQYEVTHVDRLSKGLAYLPQGGIGVVLLDLGLPDSASGLDGFERVHALTPDVPIIVLTGYDNDKFAGEAVEKGAQDYLVKGQINDVILGRSIRYAMGRQKLLVQLEHSAKEIKTLRGFLPICSRCKKIREDNGYWTQIESYISSHSDAEFSHGLCPECSVTLYPQYFKKKE